MAAIFVYWNICPGRDEGRYRNWQVHTKTRALSRLQVIVGRLTRYGLHNEIRTPLAFLGVVIGEGAWDACLR